MRSVFSGQSKPIAHPGCIDVGVIREMDYYELTDFFMLLLKLLCTFSLGFSQVRLQRKNDVEMTSALQRRLIKCTKLYMHGRYSGCHIMTIF